ncbi:MAG: S8/S53 family peptidase [Myxococcales bacterium]|nr:S8/S53 family peptidase [Myxococcales bacterium]
MPSPRDSFIVTALALSACSADPRCGCPACPAPDQTSAGTDSGPSDGTGTGGGSIDPPEIEHVASRPFRSFVAKIAEGETCPAPPPGWELSPPATASSSSQLTMLLARYCEYRLPPGAHTPASVPTLSDPAGVVERAVADYAQVLPQAEYLRGTNEARFASFREQLGAAFGDDAPLIDGDARPHVAIVDTAAEADAEAGWSGRSEARHGLTMGGIVSAIRCPDDEAGCDHDRLHYTRAFPPSLGDRGTVWSLNLAVLQAVERWRDLGTDAPLVLNMSVGWEWGPDDTEHLWSSRSHLLEGREGDANPALTPAEEALFLTLSWASCQGVLTIAASGNTRGGACAEVGPLAPAAWEMLPTTSFGECSALLDPSELGAEDAFHPSRLVYAAGGVGSDGKPIVNARPLSEPKRVLYASMVSVPMGDGEYSIPLTGTSVASASLSGIAAQYWALHPEDSAAEVVDAITSACSPVDGGCAASDSVPLIRADTVLGQLYTTPSTTLVAPADAQLSPIEPPPPPSVTPLALLPPSPIVSYGDRACTTHSFSGAPTAFEDPWPELSPQPDSPICPTCSLSASTGTGGARLELEVDPEYRPRIPDAVAVLELHLGSGKVTRVDLDLANQSSCTLSPGTSQHLSSCHVPLRSYDHPDPTAASDETLASYVDETDLRAATVSFYVSDGDSTQLVGNEVDVFQP